MLDLSYIKFQCKRLVVAKVLTLLAYLIEGKLHYMVQMWFKDVDEFLINGPSMTKNKDLCS